MSSVSAHLLAIREVQVSGGDDEASELTLAARGCLAGSEASAERRRSCAHVCAQGAGRGAQAQDGPPGRQAEAQLRGDLSSVVGGGVPWGDSGGKVHGDECQGSGL